MPKYLVELTHDQLCMLERAMWKEIQKADYIQPLEEENELYGLLNGITAKSAVDADGKQIIYSFCS